MNLGYRPHLRGHLGEQNAGYALGARNFDILVGPSGTFLDPTKPKGSGGHGITAHGFDIVALGRESLRILILDNKSNVTQRNVASASAIDTNAIQNLQKFRDDFAGKAHDEKDHILRELDKELNALKNGGPGSKYVHWGVTSEYGPGVIGVTDRLRREGIEHLDLAQAKNEYEVISKFDRSAEVLEKVREAEERADRAREIAQLKDREIAERLEEMRRADDGSKRDPSPARFMADEEKAEIEARNRRRVDEAEASKIKFDLEKGTREAEEEAKRETQEKADREARERAEREAREAAEREAREATDREAKAAYEMKEKADRAAREAIDMQQAADREVREALEAKDKADRALQEAREAREKAEREAQEREQAEKEAAEARDRAEKEAAEIREKAEREVREALQAQEAAEKELRAALEAQEKAEKEAREALEAQETADREAREAMEAQDKAAQEMQERAAQEKAAGHDGHDLAIDLDGEQLASETSGKEGAGGSMVGADKSAAEAAGGVMEGSFASDFHAFTGRAGDHH